MPLETVKRYVKVQMDHPTEQWSIRFEGSPNGLMRISLHWNDKDYTTRETHVSAIEFVAALENL